MWILDQKAVLKILISSFLYPFNLDSDFGTEIILQPKMALVRKYIYKKANFGSKMDSVLISLTR